MSNILEVVGFGHCDKEIFCIEIEDSPVMGSVWAMWKKVENTPYWVQIDGPSPGALSTRQFLLGATLRQMGVVCTPNQGDCFDYKEFCGSDAWDHYMEDGFMI